MLPQPQIESLPFESAVCRHDRHSVIMTLAPGNNYWAMFLGYVR